MRRLWVLIFAATVLLVGGTIAVLWPAFEAAGAPVAAGMIAALLAFSLGPALLLRKLMRQPRHRADEEAAEPKDRA